MKKTNTIIKLIKATITHAATLWAIKQLIRAVIYQVVEWITK